MYYFHRQPFDVRVYATACIYKFPYFLHLVIQPPGGTVCLGNELYDSVGYSAAKSLQSCPTLCDRIESSPSGSTVPAILKARTLEWVAISFSSAWKWKGKVKSLSPVWLLATPWTAAYQAPLSMGFSRQEYWSGVPLPSPHDSLATLIKRHSIPT